MNGSGSGFWADEYGQYEEGQEVPRERSLVLTEQPQYQSYEGFAEAWKAQDRPEVTYEVANVDSEDTMAEEEARRQWEGEYKAGETKEPWGDRWKRFKKERQEGASKRAVRTAEKLRKKALRLREDVAIARLESTKRQYGGTKVQKAKRLLKEFEFGSKPGSMKTAKKETMELYIPPRPSRKQPAGGGLTVLQGLTSPPQVSAADIPSVRASLVQPRLERLRRPQLGMGQLSGKVLPPARLAQRPSVRKKGVI